MAGNNNDEELTYRSPVGSLDSIMENQAQPTPQQSADEAHFGTLLETSTYLHDRLDGLHRDFNAFSIPKEQPKEAALAILLRQIDGKQEAYDILLPIMEHVDNAIRLIDSNYRKDEVK